MSDNIFPSLFSFLASCCNFLYIFAFWEIQCETTAELFSFFEFKRDASRKFEKVKRKCCPQIELETIIELLSYTLNRESDRVSKDPRSI